VLVEYLIPPKNYCNSSGGACFFLFHIDVKGGEEKHEWMLQLEIDV
jgi:hypothetical protein